MTFEQAKAKFTAERHGRKYSIRRKADQHFGRICTFFDTEKRCCTIYAARPSVCRSYPGGLRAFVAAMNEKAHVLGMNDTHYVEPTGLSS